MSHYCDSMFPGNCGYPGPRLLRRLPLDDELWVQPLERRRRRGRGMAPWSVMVGHVGFRRPNHCTPGATACTMAMAAFKADVQWRRANIQYTKYNNFLFGWFNNALAAFQTDVSDKRAPASFPLERRSGHLGRRSCPGRANPFQGSFDANAARPSRTWGPTANSRLPGRCRRIRVGVPTPGTVSCAAPISTRGSARSPTWLGGMSTSCASAASTTSSIPMASWSSGRILTARPQGWLFQQPIRQDVLPVRRRAGHADAGVVLKDTATRQPQRSTSRCTTQASSACSCPSPTSPTSSAP